MGSGRVLDDVGGSGPFAASRWLSRQQPEREDKRLRVPGSPSAFNSV